MAPRRCSPPSGKLSKILHAANTWNKAGSALNEFHHMFSKIGNIAVEGKALRAVEKVDRFLRKRLGRADLFSEFRRHIIYDNIWQFSQRKTGTTLLYNTIGFYNALQLGVQNPSFSDMSKYGLARAMHDRFDELEGLSTFSRTTGKRWLVQSHTFIDAAPYHLILQSRNALDYCVSSYFYFYKLRKGFENTHIDRAIGIVLDGYIQTHKAQSLARRKTRASTFVSYEDLKTKPIEALGSVLKNIYDTVDFDVLEAALELSNIDRLKEHELSVGSPLVASKGSMKTNHFVRSGQIGEGEAFFTSKQIDFIRTKLKEADVPLAGTVK